MVEATSPEAAVRHVTAPLVEECRAARASEVASFARGGGEIEVAGIQSAPAPTVEAPQPVFTCFSRSEDETEVEKTSGHKCPANWFATVEEANAATGGEGELMLLSGEGLSDGTVKWNAPVRVELAPPSENETEE